MKISIEVSNEELFMLACSADELKEKFHLQLEEATIGKYFPAITISSVDYTIEIKETK